MFNNLVDQSGYELEDLFPNLPRLLRLPKTTYSWYAGINAREYWTDTAPAGASESLRQSTLCHPSTFSGFVLTYRSLLCFIS
jgi:hypothetical protein